MIAPKFSLFTTIYWLQIVFFSLSLPFILPQGVWYYPLIITPGIILLTIAFLRRKLIFQLIQMFRRKETRPDRKIFLNPAETICLMSFLCSLYFFATSVIFYFSSSLQSPILFCLATIVCIYLIIHYYIAHLDPANSVFVKPFFNILKLSWVLITAYSYVGARKNVMELIDISYEKTFSMTTTFGLAAVKYTYYSCLFLLPLSLSWPRSVSKLSEFLRDGIRELHNLPRTGRCLH